MSFNWKNLPKHFFVLAPMADVTDMAYREMVHIYSGGEAAAAGCSVMWTEFVSCDGLAHEIGQWNLLRDLQYHEFERPLIAQLFGSRPENFEKAARLCVELGFDGVDINMGCPVKTINDQGAGACLIKTPDIAKEVIRATKKGIADACINLGKEIIPVSVKTRIGWTNDETDTWIPAILECGIDALTIHARTRKEMSDPPPHWDIMKKVVEIAKPYNIPVIANGGMLCRDDAFTVMNETGSHGAMIGKGTFGAPWFFNTHYNSVDDLNSVPREAKLRAAIEHTKLWQKYMGDIGPHCAHTELVFGDVKKMTPPFLIKGKNFSIMKKNFRCYINNFAGAKELRIEVMELETPDEVIARLEKELK